MKKLILLAGVATLAMPVAAIADRGHDHGYDRDTSSRSSTSTWASTGRFDETTRADVTYTNDLDASIDVDVEYDKKLALYGGARVHGDIDVNSSAVAVNDPKLLSEQNEATSNGPQLSTVDSVSGNGNVGVNAAAGFNNVQANMAAIATAPGGERDHHDRDGNAGWAEATTIAFQKSYSNDLNQAGSNTARVGSVSGNGNIGVNSAAGAFNTQSNLLTMAVVKDGALAEANAGALLVALENRTTATSGAGNTATIGSVNGNGNVGVNVAAGAGNVQHNSLTIATTMH